MQSGDDKVKTATLARRGGDAQSAAADVQGTLTPADQLPLPTKGGVTPMPTEATRDNSSPDPSRHLDDNPRPSPLLAGSTGQEWRQRLANFHPRDPLPDPRTSTGDKAIDTLAFASGQQNTTYAWGGNKRTDSPSSGTLALDVDGGATQHRDDSRVGYDCGGLVRFAVAQAAGFDTGMGTIAIDTCLDFTRVVGGLGSGQAAAQAEPGDVLVFGAHCPFGGDGTFHTGIYIGNGYMINAPQSGQPVQVDPVGVWRGATDILRVIRKPTDPDAFPLPHGYFYGPLDGPDQCISGEYPGDPQAWRDGLGRWQKALGLPVTKKWDDGQTPQAATTLQHAKNWPPTPGIGYGTVHQGEWDAVIKEKWRLPKGWTPATLALGGQPASKDFPLPQGYFWGPLTGPEECISGEYPDEPQAWRNGLGRWQKALGLPVTKKWDDGQTPQAATTLQHAKNWPPTPGIGYGTVHQGEWDAVIKEKWRLPKGWDAGKAPAQAKPKPDEFPLPQGYFWGPLSGPQQCVSGEYPDEPQAWRDGLGRWQKALGLPVTKKWNDGHTPQAATTLQLERRWPMTPGIGYGTVHLGEWDAVFKERWRLPEGWDASKVTMAGPVSSAAAIAVSQVLYDRGGFASGKDAYLGYLAQTLDLMGITDQWARDRWTTGACKAANCESSYDPDAINNWDVNSKPPNSTFTVSDGYGNGCSRGVLQCVPGTFAQYHQPGTSTNIYDPVANTAAAMNYVMAYYGVRRDGSNLATNVQQFDPNRVCHGY